MNERTSIMGRMFLVLGLVLLLPFGILLQLVRVNIVEGDGLRHLWSTQAIDQISIPAQRGNIYDENGSLLVTNSVGYKIAIDPKAPGVSQALITNVCRLLSQHTERSSTFYMNRIRSAPKNSRYIVLEKSIPIQAYEEINQLDLKGVILEEQYVRNYNFGSLSAHILGFINHNNDGMSGLEAAYNKELKGEDGIQQVRRDRSNNIFAYVGAPQKKPRHGYSLHTTINATIQAIVEEELENGLKRHLAKQGTAIVMDPKTGAIKALANYPTFDPNHPASSDLENRRNYAVSDMFEPGSTFKLVTALAAVEQNAVSFDEIFETPEKGQRLIHGQWMRDHDPLGTLDFKGAIAKSSNIATSEIALRIKPDILYQYARNLGFGSVASIDLPNESAGRLQKPYEWSKVTQPWMSIGYEVQVTPLQIAQAYSAFANDGLLMQPYIVDRVTDDYGNIVRQSKPTPVRRIAKKETINKLMPVFEEVVSDSGTAEWAAVDGLRVAGKTGTAQKYIDGRYRTKYRSSFVGFFPVEDPKYLIFVLLDEPKTSIYGGFTAGSVFKQSAIRIAGLDNMLQRTNSAENVITDISSQTAPQLQGLDISGAKSLLNSIGLPFKTVGNGSMVVSQLPEPGQRLHEGDLLELKLDSFVTDGDAGSLIEIPELRNLSMRQAASILYSLGLNFETIGSGTIYNQFPKAGEKMRKGRTVTIRGRAISMEKAAAIAAGGSK